MIRNYCRHSFLGKRKKKRKEREYRRQYNNRQFSHNSSRTERCGVKVVLHAHNMINSGHLYTQNTWVLWSGYIYTYNIHEWSGFQWLGYLWFRKIVLEADSEAVARIVNHPAFGWNTMLLFWTSKDRWAGIVVQYVYREVYSCAD